MTDDVGVLARLDAVACDDLTRARWNQAGRRRVGRQAVGRLESFASVSSTSIASVKPLFPMSLLGAMDGTLKHVVNS